MYNLCSDHSSTTELIGRRSPNMMMGERLFTPIKPAEGVSMSTQMALLGMMQKSKQHNEASNSASMPQPQPQKNGDEDYRKTVVKQKCECSQT